MLESIQVTERLHWPELELSKKYLLSPTDRPVSLSQVSVQKLSSSVLKDIFTTGTSSYNVLLQTVEERKSPKHSPYKKPQTPVRCSSSSAHRKDGHQQALNPVPLAGPEWCGSPKLSSCTSGAPRPGHAITVTGSTMGLAARPRVRPRKLSVSSSVSSSVPRTRLPLLGAGGGARDGENSARKLCILTAIKPSNVDKEKAKFFKSDFTYNPQFEYSNPASPLVLDRHSNASDKFLTQAVRILELAVHKYGNYEKFEQATGGSLLTKSRICYHVKKYMEKEGCVGEIVVHLTDDLLSRASMTVVNGRPTLTINISMAREHWLEGMLRHEIGTHYFRGINNSQQPWSSGAGRKKHGLRPLNPTEEGLASIHSVLFRKDPTLWRAALLYYTVYQASRLSFSQLFHNLRRFVRDPNTRWDYCVRAKRGQMDTGQPGCFSKDQVYLDGVLKILRHRDNIDFLLLTALGKVSYEDVDRLTGLASMEHVRIPHFLQDQTRYREQLDKIMEVNQLTDEELQALI
ncbi:putative tyrosine carboxypeptidase MATCAP2 [Conger conger]|uniref:putative tyrosine carboxypeptidase MATCAP2 n=1 Tax=Conger conger TaxID=82655 RepID=UPI002A5AEE89|nr:putative tyrosine carboxypeptidase MATCAP2 [Conger conger]